MTSPSTLDEIEARHQSIDKSIGCKDSLVHSIGVPIMHTDRGKLLAALRAVEAVHRKSYAPHPRGLDEPSVFICLECLDQWPCPTIRAIEGALG